jgi:DNA-directed RNA polymerase subunit RPC12/RpoP
MFAVITCPACQHKLTIPEGTMGKRQTCPNCHSPFLAGKSVAEEEVPMKLEPAAVSPFNKTMLGETEPPIRYNCPRCKKPLEAPASEAGIKKPCPACGQRIQVPAPPAATAPSALNKTMLAETGPPIRYNCPNCKKPLESPASEAGIKKPCPACGQRLQVPSQSPTEVPKPNLNKTMLATDESKAPSSSAQTGQQQTPMTASAPSATAQPASSVNRNLAIAGLGIGALLILTLLACIITGMILGPRTPGLDPKVQQEIAALKAEIEQKKTEIANQQKAFDALIADQKARQERLDLQRDLDARNQQYLNDKNLAAEAKAKRDQEQRDLDQRKQFEAQMKSQLEATQKALDAANQRQTTIIQQAPPPVYWYSPRYYYPWW